MIPFLVPRIALRYHVIQARRCLSKEYSVVDYDCARAEHVGDYGTQKKTKRACSDSRTRRNFNISVEMGQISASPLEPN